MERERERAKKRREDRELGREICWQEIEVRRVYQGFIHQGLLLYSTVSMYTK